MKCKICGNEVINGADRFCKVCGTKLLGQKTVTLDFKQLSIIKHSLQYYITRNGAKVGDKLVEIAVLEEIIKVLDSMY